MSARKVSLPRISEIKRTLDGREKQFDCAVLRRVGPHMVVLFVSSAAMHVHGVDLPAATVTFGHFWTDRPYNVYHWLDGTTGATIACYVNLSDQTTFDDGRLEWRDLAIDVLIARDGTASVWDEDEVPADTPPALRARIDDALVQVLARRADLLAELEAERGALWSVVAAGGEPTSEPPP